MQAIIENTKILIFKAEYESANSNGSSKIPFVKNFGTSLLHSIETDTPVSFVAFSNTGKYLLTWNRVSSSSSSNSSSNQSLEESNSQQKDNLLIWEIFSESPKVIAKFYQKQTPDKSTWYVFLF